jgi:hypothetical protein
MPGLMSGDWKRSTVSGPQRLQPVRGQRRTYRPPRQPSTLPAAAAKTRCPPAAISLNIRRTSSGCGMITVIHRWWESRHGKSQPKHQLSAREDTGNHA